MYPNMIKILAYIAKYLIKKDLPEIMANMTEEERVSFVNSIRTLQEPADYIQKNTLWRAS